MAQSEGSEFFEAATKYLQDDIDLNNKGADDAARQAAATYSSSRLWIICLLAGAVALGSVIAVTLARSIALAATGMLAMIQQVVDKNLTVEDIKVNNEDEVGLAGMALNHMKNNLHEMIQSILDNDHYGLEKVKERIVEYLAKNYPPR